MHYQSKLLVIDDEANIRYSIKTVFESEKLQILEAASGKQGIAAFQEHAPSAVLLDVKLPDMHGLDVFDQIHALDERIPVILMTAYSTTETAIRAMQRGAFEYFVKPIDIEALKEVLEKALQVSKQNQVPAVLPASDKNELDVDQIIGESQAMQEVYKSIGRVAAQNVTVLILGESGTGKELVARSIYHYSKRNRKPFLAVNCAALSESLLESELFGHEKGAFTGADQRRIGKFEQVNGGTIFLDEIGDMSLKTQSKALRLLQQQQFERIGGNTTIQTDVRIIAATNKDLVKMVESGSFRQDLFYRLNVFTIQLPALRERPSDIPILVNHFLRTVARDTDRPVAQFTESAMSMLLKHLWPGNVRELYSAIRYATLKSKSTMLGEDCLPPSLTGQTWSETVNEEWLRERTRQLLASDSNDIYREIIREVDSIVVDEVLKATNGNQQTAAERLGISRITLRGKYRLLSANTEYHE